MYYCDKRKSPDQKGMYATALGIPEKVESCVARLCVDPLRVYEESVDGKWHTILPVLP